MIQLYHQIIDDLNSEYPIIELRIRELKSIQNLHFQLYDETQGKAEYDPTTYYNALFWVQHYEMFFNDKYPESLSFITEDQIHERLKKYIKQEKKTSTVFYEWNEFKIHEVRPYLGKHGIKNTKQLFDVQSHDFFLMQTANLIVYPKLMKQYGSVELDQLLFTLRFKTAWLLENLNQIKESNREFEVFLKNKLGIVEQQIANLPEVTMLLTEGKSVDKIIEIIRKENPETPLYDISKDAINNLGYYLMDDRKYTDALKIFELGTVLYPNWFNSYDSYGECLFKLQDYKNALKAYERALELNPNSGNSRKMLNYLNMKGEELK